MQVNDLRVPKGAKKRKKIVGRGRGSGLGKTSGRGQTGQKSRSGRGILNALEGGQMPLLRRLPKVGFTSHRPKVYDVVKLAQLDVFKANSKVDVNALKQKGLIKSVYRPYKVLGVGELSKPLTVQAYQFSKSAEEKIVQAGGQVERIDRKAVKAAQDNKQTKS